MVKQLDEDTIQLIICRYVSGKSYKQIENRYHISHRQMEKIMKNFYKDFEITDNYRKLLMYIHRTHKNEIPAKIIKKYMGWQNPRCSKYKTKCHLPEIPMITDLYDLDVDFFLPFVLEGIDCNE